MVSDVDTGGSYTCVGAGVIWKICKKYIKS